MGDYPAWICTDCGTKHGKPRGAFATYHNGECGWCGRMIAVTEPRDFCYPTPPETNGIIGKSDVMNSPDGLDTLPETNE